MEFSKKGARKKNGRLFPLKNQGHQIRFFQYYGITGLLMVRFLLFSQTLAFSALLIPVIPATALPGRSPDLHWKVDVARSFVHFRSKMLFTTVAGSFGRMNLESLDFSWNPRLLRGRMSVEIDSLDTGIAKRDTHLKEEDFFWVERYPNAIVDVSGIYEDKGQHFARISVEIRGVRKDFLIPVTLTVDWATIQGKGELTLNRRDFGVRGNILTNTIINDRVLIEYAIVLVRK